MSYFRTAGPKNVEFGTEEGLNIYENFLSHLFDDETGLHMSDGKKFGSFILRA